MSYGDGKYINRGQFWGLWDYLWWLQTIKHLAWGYFHSFHSLRYALLISNLVNCLQPQLLQSELLQPCLLHATRPPNLTTSSGPFRVRMGCSSELKGTDVTVELSSRIVKIMGMATSMLFSRLALLISRARKALVLITLMDDARRCCGKMYLGFRTKYGIWRFRAFRL